MTIFLSGFGLGLTLVATPGAVTAEAVRRGLEGGFYAALRLQIGSLVGLVLWSAVGLTGAALLAVNALVKLVLAAGGSIVLFVLSVQALRAAFQGGSMEAAAPQPRGDFGLGAVLSVLNPVSIVFWLGIGSVLMPVPTPFTVTMFYTGLILSALLWFIILAGLTAWGRRFVTPTLFRFVNLVCGLVLGAFALRLAAELV